MDPTDRAIKGFYCVLRKKYIKKEKQKSEGTHYSVDLSLELATLHQCTILMLNYFPDWNNKPTWRK